MPVIPYRTNLFQDQKDLYQFLLTCQTTALTQDHPQIVSISLALPQLDPLVVLQTLSQPGTLHFYWETGNRARSCAAVQNGAVATEELSQEIGYEPPLAIVGVDAAAQLQTEGTDRFAAAQTFIQACLRHTTAVGDLQLPYAGPHFFCGFTFFEQGQTFPAARVFLPRWQVAAQGSQSVVVANVPVEVNSNLPHLATEVWQTLEMLYTLPDKHRNFTPAPGTTFQPVAEASRDTFKTAVVSALNSIHRGDFHKIVLAETFDVEAQQPFQISNSLHNLRQLYPDCYVFAVSNEAGQIFVGASPERLIKIRDHQLLTDALAGSAPRGQTAAEDADLANQLLHSHKDRFEHQVVAKFITQCLCQLGLKPQLAAAPHLLQLPNIQHLRTVIRAAIPRQCHLLEILAALHPTPAVAGAPREISCQQIRYYEAFERDLFGSPLGWIDHQGNGEFVVGIRSALIDGPKARLYAGAGIVAASDPDKEVAEIQLKLQVLLQALA